MSDYSLFDKVHSIPPHPEAAALGMTDAAIQAAGGLALVKARLAAAVHKVEAQVEHVAAAVVSDVESLVVEAHAETETVEAEVDADVEQDLHTLKRAELLALAEMHGLEVAAHLKKAEIVALIEAAEQA